MAHLKLMQQYLHYLLSAEDTTNGRTGEDLPLSSSLELFKALFWIWMAIFIPLVLLK